MRKGIDPTALHTAALVDLLYEEGGGKSLQRAISSLQTAAQLADRPAPVLADLAAAYIVRAERTNSLRDLIAAVEAAEEALEHEPRNSTARYNLALGMERLDLPGEAAREWGAYLEPDLASGWVREARRHLRQVLAMRTEPPPPAPDAPLTAHHAYAAAEPQRARELGWCRVLGAWAGAVLHEDSAGVAALAERHLQRAETLGTVLEQRAGGDASLADAVRAIRAQAGTPRLRRLAQAHSEFSAGCEAERRIKFAVAEQAFARAVALADDSPALRAWARLSYGSAVFLGGDPEQGQAIVHAVAGGADSLRHPALVGRALRVLSASLLRGDIYEEGLRHAHRARRLFAGAGEWENEGAALDALAYAQGQLRDLDQGYAFTRLALERLRPYRNSHRLISVLSRLAEVAAEDGFPRAALRIQDESVQVAERTSEDVYVAEERLARAQLFADAGKYSRARSDVVVALAAIDRIPDVDPTVRDWLVARRQMAGAPELLRTAPARAARSLDSATTFFQDTMGTTLIALPAIVAGAHARLAAGESGQGIARLEAALRLLERRRDQIRMEPRRATVFEDARTLVDRATMLMLASGRTGEALRYLDRGRASLATVGAASQEVTAAGRPGEVALVFAQVGDTLLAWTVAGERKEFVHRTVLSASRLAGTVERLRRQLEASADDAELREGLSQLYEWLVRPIEARLGAAETPLVVIADGDLGSVPFAALYDARRGRYLVEDYPLRFAASLSESRRPPRRASGGAASYFIADPAFDARKHPGFPRLPEAAEEARQIAAAYPGGEVLGDTAAHDTGLRAALRQAGLVHYAGHAVFDDERPERSYLLLAPTRGDSTAGTLQAGDIAEMDLRHLSLVVLAACQTVRTGPGRAAGFSGLAGAFLAAGAGGAVGSLWQVEDRLTRPLMIEFHRAYRAAPDGASALRAAQLRLLRSGDPALHSPAAWAGFRYAGN
jgi:CHAT domain-containing protein